MDELDFIFFDAKITQCLLWEEIEILLQDYFPDIAGKPSRIWLNRLTVL